MKKVILLVSIFSILFVGCNQDIPSQYRYRPPENINDGLDVGALDEVNIDPVLIEQAVNSLYQGRYKEVHSMLICKDGKLVFEEYFKGHKFKWDGVNHHGDLVTWDRSMSHCNHSVTKSITSACIGIAIDRGFIENVHQSIFDYLPEYQQFGTGGKEKITIENLLTMTSGLEWDEWSAPLSSPENDIIGIWFSDKDPITYILEKPLIDKPGTSFTYSGGNMIILGEIIRYAANMNIDEFSGKYLFKPLEIDSSNWYKRFENGVIEAGGGLKIKPRDMAKIGVTFLNKGVWNGTRVISEQWIEKSAASFPGNQGIKVPGEDSGRNGYSYSWWIKSFFKSDKRSDMFSAGGWGGQHIMILPELNTVVAFTGGNYISYRPAFKILKKFIIPAIN
ncbi:MAG: serine hydrolase [candidate division Zixibacteria bacterium]|nr:serine hydrolase [candidate division Zixibacteria bacterium]